MGKFSGDRSVGRFFDLSWPSPPVSSRSSSKGTGVSPFDDPAERSASDRCLLADRHAVDYRGHETPLRHGVILRGRAARETERTNRRKKNGRRV